MQKTEGEYIIRKQKYTYRFRKVYSKYLITIWLFI